MPLLIDGYNLLHASGVFPAAAGPPTLERSRVALLDYLVASLSEKEIRRTIVVFDAVGAPPNLPRELTHQGLAVRFARRGGSADELLEELIAAEPDPRNLLVVSSDHRVQRAARQRGAQYQDSEAWQADLVRTRRKSSAADPLAGKISPPIENPFPPGYASDVFDE